MTLGYNDEPLETLANIADEVVVEANFGDGMYTKLLEPIMERIYPCTLTEVKHSKQKELRIIDTLEPVMMQHRLVFNQDVIERDYKETAEDPTQGLFYQMTRITRDRGALLHDDRLDALAIAVNYWVESMQADAKKEQEKHRGKLFDLELKKFAKTVFGFRDRNRAEKGFSRR